jgi:hypothetical protein
MYNNRLNALTINTVVCKCVKTFLCRGGGERQYWHRLEKWTTLRPPTIFLETLFEDVEKEEGGRNSSDVTNSLYSFVEISLLFIIIFYEETSIFLLSYM